MCRGPHSVEEEQLPTQYFLPRTSLELTEQDLQNKMGGTPLIITLAINAGLRLYVIVGSTLLGCFPPDQLAERIASFIECAELSGASYT